MYEEDTILRTERPNHSRSTMDSTSVPETTSERAHAVLLPFPAQEHINPMLKLAILLHSRGSLITFVNTEYNHRRLLRSRGPEYLNGLPDFKFETIPDGLPPTDADIDATQDIASLCYSTRKSCLGPFRALLQKLNSSPDSSLVTCIIADAVMTFALSAAQDIGIPCVCFRTTSAGSFLGNRYHPLLQEKGLIPPKDSTNLSNGYLETSVDFLPGMKNFRLKDFTVYIRTTDPRDVLLLNFVTEEAKEAARSAAIIFNTFDALEGDMLNTLSKMCPPIFTLGPLQLLIHQLPENSLKFLGASLWKEEPECLQWLDSKPQNSVVYVNFGSITVLSPQQLVELAWGLANSTKNFLWIIRSNLVTGGSTMLPPEFLQETKERGLISSWCPQEQVLNHPSIGAFLTHCGWNSMIESLAYGVPMICWPFSADQNTNCRLACTEWGAGVEIINSQYLDRNEVETLIREVIDGKKMKDRAVEWKRKAKEATGIYGSSFMNLDRLVEFLRIKP